MFCDVDRSLNIDPADFERKITPRTKAVIAVHYQGSPANLSQVLEIAHRHGVRVLEDCAQAIGARYQGRPVGTLGDVGIYSLQGNKVVTSGEGGIVVSSDALIFERARALSRPGLSAAHVPGTAWRRTRPAGIHRQPVPHERSHGRRRRWRSWTSWIGSSRAAITHGASCAKS